MPLHAITEVYGEAGLRDRFALELETFPPAEREQLRGGAGAGLQAARRRPPGPRAVPEPPAAGGDPDHAVLRHPGRGRDHRGAAARRGRGPSGGAGRTRQRHVTPELTDAAVAELARRFNPRVAELVRSVTNPEYDPDRDRNEQYRMHVAESLDRDPWARVIKVSDFTDNGVGVIHTTSEKAYQLGDASTARWCRSCASWSDARTPRCRWRPRTTSSTNSTWPRSGSPPSCDG